MKNNIKTIILGIGIMGLIAAGTFTTIMYYYASINSTDEEDSNNCNNVIFAEMNSSDNTNNNDLFKNAKIRYINDNPDLFTPDLSELITRNPETLDYVYNYPTAHLKEYDVDISEDVEIANGDIPYFSQYDARWGYNEYGTGLVGYTGCGPTALSMVVVYLTGDESFSPDFIAYYAIENDYCIPGNGTAWDLMSEGCEAFGVYSYSLLNEEEEMKNALDNNNPIICIMGPGDFTSEGHFIVISGYCEDGFIIKDSFSEERTNKIWSYNELSYQIEDMWAFYS
ncbi:MAG: C39 family peptidase [Clostridia bacterium]|nr:C39 family peptidase [Clostridia bacterium]